MKSVLVCYQSARNRESYSLFLTWWVWQDINRIQATTRHQNVSRVRERKRYYEALIFFHVFDFVYADMTTEAVALTSDKLAGGPLREFLEKTQEHVALRSLQFWEDTQRYLSPPDYFSSYRKYHSAKTLIATYIAPDSPRKMAMSPQVRADLMRLLPEERGDYLLSTVAKTLIQVNSYRQG